MLSMLRHKGVSQKILWVVAGIIILSFGVFGTAYRLDTTINSAGKIFGQSVPLRDFEKAYLDSRDQGLINYGDRFMKMGNQVDLEREAWTRLMLLHEAQKAHITASDKEVIDLIATMPFFQREGRFDRLSYEMILQSPSYFDRRPKDFEEGIRRSIMIKKLLDQVAGPAHVSEDELKAEYIKRNEKIKLNYVLFTPDGFNKGLTASDKEIADFYNQHKDLFKQPPMVNVQYVHLLYPEKADEKQKQAVKQTALNIAKELSPKVDFAAIAAKYKTDVKESGFFTQEEPLLTFAWSPEFVDKIFAMKTGDISNPMESPDGWQIVKIKEIKPAGTPELNTIMDKVKDALINQKATELAQQKATETLKTIQEKLKTADFKAVAGSLGLSTAETTEFSRGEYINAPGLIAEFQEPSYKLNEGNKLSDVVMTSQGPAILYLSTVEKIDPKKYAEDKEDFRQMMSAQKRNQAIGAYVNKVRFEANLKTDLKNKVHYR